MFVIDKITRIDQLWDFNVQKCDEIESVAKREKFTCNFQGALKKSKVEGCP